MANFEEGTDMQQLFSFRRDNTLFPSFWARCMGQWAKAGWRRVSAALSIASEVRQSLRKVLAWGRPNSSLAGCWWLAGQGFWGFNCSACLGSTCIFRKPLKALSWSIVSACFNSLVSKRENQLARNEIDHNELQLAMLYFQHLQPFALQFLEMGLLICPRSLETLRPQLLQKSLKHGVHLHDWYALVQARAK